MNKRRLSFGLLVTLAAAVMAGCGDNPPADAPPQATAAPADTGSAAPAATDTPPPAPTATAAPEPPPPPPKPAATKLTGNFTQDWSGDVKDAADAAAKKAAGAKDKDGKKYNAAMDKASKKFTDAGSTITINADTILWTVSGKTAHTIGYAVSGSKDDPSNTTIKLGKDGKKDLKGLEVAVSFSDDNTFTLVDPFAKKGATPLKLVFKRQ
jgi:type IV secretory pathway VirB10-like protein